MRIVCPTSAVVRLWWRNSTKQQTVISSQRQYTERCDLACPHDSKSKHTQCISPWPWGISKKKKISHNFPHYPHSSLMSFRPLCHPHTPLPHPFPSSSQQSAISSLSLITIHPFHPSLLPLLLIDRKLWYKLRSQNTILSSMCAVMIRTNPTWHAPPRTL